MYSLHSRLVFGSWPNLILAGALYTLSEVLRDFFFHQVNSGKIGLSKSRPLISTYRALFFPCLDDQRLSDAPLALRHSPSIGRF